MPRLAFRPGQLTRDYVYGRRAGYIAPLALFLFSIFLMFFVFGMLGGPDVNDALAKAGGTPVAGARSEVADAKAEIADATAEIAGAKADSDSTPADLVKLTATLADDRTKLAAAEKALAVAQAAPAPRTAAKPRTRWQDDLAASARDGTIRSTRAAGRSTPASARRCRAPTSRSTGSSRRRTS